MRSNAPLATAPPKRRSGLVPFVNRKNGVGTGPPWQDAPSALNGFAVQLEEIGSLTSAVDVGVSGGVWGYDNGFSMMAGANDQLAFATLEPVLQTLAAPAGAYANFGPAGSGHFVKMTHNAIEYGMMEELGRRLPDAQRRTL